MLPFLQSVGRLINSLLDLISNLRAAYYRKKFGSIHDTVEELDKKISNGITDDEIINAARELRKRKKGLLP